MRAYACGINGTRVSLALENGIMCVATNNTERKIGRWIVGSSTSLSC